MAWTRLFRRGRLRRRRRSDERPYESQRGPKIHVGEIYGFVGAITWSVFAVLYFAWAYLPDETLHEWGIHFLPDKYWALALPVFISVTVVAIYWVYEGLSMYYSQPIHSVGSFQDEYSRFERDLTWEQRKTPGLLWDIDLREGIPWLDK
mmetsp:Transcript_3825/g.6536  ORF Transcript_3825/g.6536 Transcript_3825/m.6536 type:complete len:149 (+) Transcript_3825:283-729(+)